MAGPVPRLIIHHRENERTGKVTLEYEIDESRDWGIRIGLSQEAVEKFRRDDHAKRFLWDVGRRRPGDKIGSDQIQSRRENWREQWAIEHYDDHRRGYAWTKNGQEAYERRAYADGVEPWACRAMRVERAGYFVTPPRKWQPGPKPRDGRSVDDWTEALSRLSAPELRGFLERHAPGLKWDPRRKPRVLALLLLDRWERGWSPEGGNDVAIVAESYRAQLARLKDADKRATRRRSKRGQITAKKS
jgi:hypothetical protein